MTSPTSAKHRHNHAFTLTELLVVIGIIGMLIGILLPSVQRAIAAAERARIQADFNVISMGLDQYHTLYHDYPRLVDDPDLKVSNSQPVRKYGSESLVRALIAPYKRDPTTPLNLADDQLTDFYDGADGPGFRFRRIDGVAQGDVKGPFIPVEKFTYSDTELQDRNGNTILYYPARLVKPDIRTGANYVGDTVNSLYDTRYGDNKLYPAGTTPNAQDKMKDLRYMLGDINTNGRIDAGETALTTGDYILISAGNDGYFGIEFNASDNADTIKTKLRKMDDVIYTK